VNYICAVPKEGFLFIHNKTLEDSKKYCILETNQDVPFDELLNINGKLYNCCSRTLNKDSDNKIIVEETIFNEEEYKIAQEITCPYCGEELSDSWEMSDSEDEVYCEGCKSTYAYERDYDITYKSVPVKKNTKTVNIKSLL